MTWTRDLAWQNIELSYRSSVAYQFARYALTLDYKLLPRDVVHQAKRSLLDTLGVAIGAYGAPGRPICESLAQALRGPEEATVFGSGLRTSAPNAALVNCFLVRFLDYTDTGRGGYSIPTLLAVAERQKSNGRDFLTSQVIAFELGARFSESIASVRDGAWVSDVRDGFYVPPALGKLLGMTEEQIANAIGLCACHSLPLGVVDSNSEEQRMSRNLRSGWISYNAILSCLLAKNGFTGPIRIAEGENGINQVIYGGEMNFQRLSDFSGWRILSTRFKALPVDGSSIGHVLATLAVVTENNLRPEDIAAVRVTTSQWEVNHRTVLSKKYPRNAESADHSIFWETAVVIKERGITPESYERDENLTDPVILDLIGKITVAVDPNIPTTRGGESQITTKDGRVFRKRIENAHGYGNDPLTDAELEEKFRKMAVKYMAEKQIKQIFDTVWNVEKLDDMGKLVKLMVFQPKQV